MSDLKEFDVKITETLEKTVTIPALSREEAEEMIRQAYFGGEYILDSDNFSEVDFRVTEEREFVQDKEQLMDVLLVKPGMYPQSIQIGGGLEDLQKAVGGDIEAVYPFEEPVALIVNEEGKMNGSELNRALRDDEGNVYDIVAGDLLVVGLGEEDFCSLTPELMKHFEDKFHQPEMFIKMGHRLMVLPVPDDMVRKPDAPDKAEPKPHKSAPDRDAR